MHVVLYKPGNCTEGALEDFKVKTAKFKMNMESSLPMPQVKENKELKSRRMSNIWSPLKHHLEKNVLSNNHSKNHAAFPSFKEATVLQSELQGISFQSNIRCVTGALRRSSWDNFPRSEMAPINVSTEFTTQITSALILNVNVSKSLTAIWAMSSQTQRKRPSLSAFLPVVV